MRYFLVSLLLCLYSLSGMAQSSPEERHILAVVQRFFDALEKQDTAALKAMYVDGGRNYSVSRPGDVARVRYQDPSGIRFSSDRVIHETMRKESTIVMSEGRIAMAWVPYDLRVNNTFSHCGIDVFTLIKVNDEWKIATIAYTIEKTGCE